MFKALGLLVALYTLYSVVKGEVYAKSGVWGKNGIACGVAGVLLGRDRNLCGPCACTGDYLLITLATV